MPPVTLSLLLDGGAGSLHLQPSQTPGATHTPRRRTRNTKETAPPPSGSGGNVTALCITGDKFGRRCGQPAAASANVSLHGGEGGGETVTDSTHIGEARQQAEGEAGLHVGGGGGGLGPARGGTS